MTKVVVSGVSDFAVLGERWRDLEQRAACSFFQTWTWMGALAVERFSAPVLVEATDNGRTVALALFNRLPYRFGLPLLFLGEAGQAALDSPYIEENGVLTEAGREAELTIACVRAAARRHDLVLSGLGEVAAACVTATCGQSLVTLDRPSPFVDLAAMRRTKAGYLSQRSANTRQQIHRSDRFYGGCIDVEAADTETAALRMLDQLAVLHQQSWTARGKPGSFANPFFMRFHHALIGTAWARGEVSLLRISGGGTDIGYLYNFCFRGRMMAYQSGFNYIAGETRAKPGLTCHHAAIRHAFDRGLDAYDFLAGNDRYKRSLADRDYRQIWMQSGPAWSPRLLYRRMRAAWPRGHEPKMDLSGG